MRKLTNKDSNIMNATKPNIKRQPNQPPKYPPITRAANMPVSKPDRTKPMLRDLCSGRENWPAIGTKIWGTTEQAPMIIDAPHTNQTLEARAMTKAISMAIVMQVVTILRREHLSAIGTISSKPKAYPICVITVMKLASTSLMRSEARISSNRGWL